MKSAEEIWEAIKLHFKHPTPNGNCWNQYGIDIIKQSQSDEIAKLKKQLEFAVHSLDCLAASMKMIDFEKYAGNWQQLDPEHRWAHHFWEGGLEMRRQVAVKAKELIDQIERIGEGK